MKDKLKGNLFSKLSRLITVSVIEGGGVADPEHNLKLRLAIDKAKQSNLPKVNIERAIEKGLGSERELLREIYYEVFAPGGITFIVLATSDNPKRTLSEVRSVVDSSGGKLGNQGSVMHLFKKCGLVTFNLIGTDEESVLNFAEKINAFDIDRDEENFYVYFPYEYLGKLKSYLNDMEADSVELDFKPQTNIKVEDEKSLKKLVEFIDALESLDDVQKVFANFTPKQFPTPEVEL